MAISELTPILFNPQIFPGERLERAITAMCERDPLVDRHQLWRRTAKVVASLISAAGKLAFVPVSLQLGPALGPMSACGDSLGYFLLEYWASTGIIDDFLSPRTQAFIELTRDPQLDKGHLCKRVSVMSAAFLLALASQLPVALPGIEYTPQQFKVASGIILLVAGTLTPLRSLQLTFNDLSLRCQGSIEAKISELKTKIRDLLLENQQHFIQLPHEQKVHLVTQCAQIRASEESPAEKTRQYVASLLQDLTQPLTRTQELVRKTFSYTGLALGAGLAGVFEYVQGDYIFHTTKAELLDNNYLAAVLATLGVASTAYLVAFSIATTTQRIFNAAADAAIGREFRNLSWQLRPKSACALTSIGFIIDLLGIASTFVILGNFYKDDEAKRDAFIATTCTSLFLLLFTSTLDVIDQMASYSIARGTEEEQSILTFSHEYLQLADLIKQSPSREFMGYLTHMDGAEQAALLERIDVSAEHLDALADQLG